ncbi:SDR family NAD(P)-dependent oxidoreductase [Saccharophagus degradans]|uniref:SDR family NAD(P)-dependent oxidoreductase n=1 Tax=Saccharophagus degradans TaxID=86304 RepID=A0AAW7X965_9GAMM|nr:SDR family NAD(P)-dependent oxidoreductase [Saccharophagus degradans]MDO6422929.1 SDR family NAD(P)-dependent oxidoreductase [Saccharophagus degradans]MDO6607074.1 SDR family NAD(P)-dependent oxidoreductase [Saccharophagus degradans]
MSNNVMAADKKIIFITGCSTGIGFCAAKTLVERGYHVIAGVRNMASADALREANIEDIVEIDLASSQSIERAVQQVLAISKGNLYALFNNAAYGQPGAVEDLTRDTLRKQFETNFFGTHELTIKLLPTLLQQKDARLIQNSSILGFAAMPMRGAYNASKFALEGLTDTLRLELAGSSLKISLIEPGPIESHFRKNALVALEENVDIHNTRHSKMYKTAIERLRKVGPAAPFTLPADAVVAKLIHALESRRPKQRYFVTVPTYAMAILKVLLPGRWMDYVLRKAGS